ncbi:unnamed protein product [Cuscuta campestris]|uniref:Uncharacterized protein n=1 Tax=Cuscuta campestris TaxID=132261 RepID=A0A484MX80_9ASTE|nr:unnamed protein product [Cuscuta campestris]
MLYKKMLLEQEIFPPSVTPLAGLRWSDNLLKQEYTEPATDLDLEENLEKLLKGDPFTGQMYHYGSLVWRIQPGGEGTSRAHEAAGHGVPSPGNTAEAGAPSHPDPLASRRRPARLLLLAHTHLLRRPSRSNRKLLRSTLRRKLPPVQEDGGESSHQQGEGKDQDQESGHHPSVGEEEGGGEDVPVTPSLEELWVKMGLKLKKIGEVGSDALEQLSEGSPSRSSKLKEKLREAEERNRELQEVIARQIDEMANLSSQAGKVGAENLHLKKENLQLMGEVSNLKEDAEQKEQEFLGRAHQWMGENLVEAARVLTSTPEKTMEGFKLLYREERGKEMMTDKGLPIDEEEDEIEEIGARRRLPTTRRRFLPPPVRICWPPAAAAAALLSLFLVCSPLPLVQL